MLDTHAPCSKHYLKILDHFLESDLSKREFEALDFRLSESGSFRELDSIYSDFCVAVESHLNVKELTPSRKKHKPWWNPYLTKLRKVTRQAHTKWKSKTKFSCAECHVVDVTDVTELFRPVHYVNNARLTCTLPYIKLR